MGGAVISSRNTFLGAQSLHPLPTPATPETSQSHLASREDSGPGQLHCPHGLNNPYAFPDLTTPNPVKVCIPLNASQLMVPTFIQILKAQATFTPVPTPAVIPGCSTLKSTPQPVHPQFAPPPQPGHRTSHQIPAAASHLSPFSHGGPFQPILHMDAM